MNTTHSMRYIALLLGSILLAGGAAPLQAQDDARDALLGGRFLGLINSKPMAADSADDDLTRLLKARHNVALEGLQVSYKDYKRHLTEVDAVFTAARRVVDSRLGVAQSPQEKLDVYEQLLGILTELEQIYRRRVETLGGGASDLIRIRYAKLTAEIEQLNIKRSLAAAN